MYDLHGLLREGKIPSDSHRDRFATGDRRDRRVRDASGNVRPERSAGATRHRSVRLSDGAYTRKVEESKALNRQHGPMIIIAASGMVESGRILHHLRHGASDPRNTILIVGFQAEHTLGRRIVEKRPVIKVFGEDVELTAQVEILNGYSAHGDRTQLRDVAAGGAQRRCANGRGAAACPSGTWRAGGAGRVRDGLARRRLRGGRAGAWTTATAVTCARAAPTSFRHAPAARRAALAGSWVACSCWR